MLLFATVYASESIHYFELKNRTAVEIIPILEPLLTQREAVSGDGYQLFIKTTDVRAEEIEKLIQSIDRATKTFRISVTSDEYIALSQNYIDVSARVESGDADVRIGNDRYIDKGISVHADARTINDQRNKTQFIRVQEGKPAFISREKARLVPVYSYVKRSYGIAVIDHEHTPFSTEDGFYVEARSSGEKHANVSIQTASGKNNRYQKHDYEQQYAETTLRVPLGQWFEIGGNTDSYESSSKGILYRTKEKEDRYNKIFIKIELIN